MSEKKDEDIYGGEHYDIFDDYGPKPQEIESETETKNTIEKKSEKTFSDKTKKIISGAHQRVMKIVTSMKRDPAQENLGTTPDENFLSGPLSKIFKTESDESGFSEETSAQETAEKKTGTEATGKKYVFEIVDNKKSSKKDTKTELPKLKQNKDVNTDETKKESSDGNTAPATSNQPTKDGETLSDNIDSLYAANVIYSAPMDKTPKPEKGPDLMQVAVKNTEIRNELLDTEDKRTSGDMMLDEIIASSYRRTDKMSEKIIEKAPEQPIATNMALGSNMAKTMQKEAAAEVDKTTKDKPFEHNDETKIPSMYSGINPNTKTTQKEAAAEADKKTKNKQLEVKNNTKIPAASKKNENPNTEKTSVRKSERAETCTKRPQNQEKYRADKQVQNHVTFGLGEAEKNAQGMQESVNDIHADHFNPILTYRPEYEYRTFCVMAGKFTKVVRSEYKFYRFLAQNDESDTTAVQKTTPIKEVEKPEEIKIGEAKIKPLPRAKETEKIPETNTKKSNHKSKKKKEDASKLPPPILMPAEIDVLQENKEKKEKERKKSSKPKKQRTGLKLFSSEEAFDESEFDAPEETKKIIDEYKSRDEEKEIRFQLNESFRSLFARFVTVFVLLLVSVILSIIIMVFPQFFMEQITYGWLVAGLINFVILGASLIICRVPIANGLMPLRYFKGNSDTALTVASFAVLLESTVALFYPSVFIDGTYSIYTPILLLAFLLNTIGKIIMVNRVRDNFKFLTKPFVKYSGRIFTDVETAGKMVRELPIKHPIVAYQKKTKFMSDFLKLSYAPDPCEESASKIAPFAAVISVLSALLYCIMHGDFPGTVATFALCACVTTPLCVLISANLPMARLCKSAGRKSAMVSNYAAVRQFCDTNAIMIDTNDLYPKGTVTLSGIKTFNETKIHDALLGGAAVSFAAKGTLCHVFENIIQGRMDMLPRVESVIYEDNMGLVGWVDGRRVLIGNRRLMESHNIRVPKVAYESMYRGREIAYLSISGSLCAMLVLSYRADRETAIELQKLQDCGVCFIVRTVDSNITPKHIADNFLLHPRCVTVLPTVLGKKAEEVKSGTEEKTRAYLATRGRLSSFARAVTGCIKIRASVKLSVILQNIAIVFNFVVIMAITLISGFEKLGTMPLLLYLLIWIAAVLIAPSIKKP